MKNEFIERYAFSKRYTIARDKMTGGGVMLTMNTEIISKIKGTAAPKCLKRY